MKRKIKLKVMAEVHETERIARLEEKMEALDKSLGRVENRLDKVENEIKELRELIYKLDKKFTILFLLVIFLIIFLNQNSLEFLFKMLGVIK